MLNFVSPRSTAARELLREVFPLSLIEEKREYLLVANGWRLARRSLANVSSLDRVRAMIEECGTVRWLADEAGMSDWFKAMAKC